MSIEYRYELEKGSRKHLCPACGKKTFVRYTDKDSDGDYLPNKYGRCDRETNCSYHLNPFKDAYVPQSGLMHPETLNRGSSVHKSEPQYRSIKTNPSFIDDEVLKKSRSRYTENNLVKWLRTRFSSEIANELITQYHLGTSNYWNGATIFWQIDKSGKIRTGKIMLYDPLTGKRIRSPFSHIYWMHKLLEIPDFNVQQCFFGEHLLQSDSTSTVCIVESENTALIASVYYPDQIWLATGGLSLLNAKKCKVLEGRKVFLFPDLGGFEKWKKIATEISNTFSNISIEVSDLLELNANEAEKEEGYDMADYLLKFDWRGFLPQQEKIDEVIMPRVGKEVEEEFIQINKPPLDIPIESLSPEKWDDIIFELETFFNTCILPTGPIKLDECSTIIDLPKFIEAHLSTVIFNNGNKTFRPYLDRLIELRNLIDS